jgi:amino acid adenylation domain-containing protein
MGHYETILSCMINADDHTQLRQLDMITAEETSQQVNTWNQTYQSLNGLSVDQHIALQATQTPSNPAVSFADETLTYEALESRANQLAHTLQSQGVKVGELVGICQTRSINLLVSTLAVMKTGAAYVPMDPAYPQERLDYMCQDADIKRVLIDTTVLNSDILSSQTQLIQYNVDDEALFSHHPTTAPEHEATLSDSAYVIYTSGSTGLPKGVDVSRGNLSNFIQGMQDKLSLTPQDKLLAITSLSFDIAGLELYLPLISGAKVVIGDGALSMDGQRLKETLSQECITYMQATPVSWKLLLASHWVHQDKQSFTALCGGEAFPVALANDLLKQPIEVWNLYGPTETTIWSSACHLNTHQDKIHHSVPIGRPIANTQLYVLNEEQQVMPIGAVGELYIGGEGVALGYLGREDLTQERFIETDYGRIYRTGDLARYDADGLLDCLGRIDNQVKIRGYRIELGEIELCLTRHPAVKEAVVNPYTHAGEQTLVGYVVFEDTTEQEDSAKALHDLKTHLSTQLPNYMVPSLMVTIEQLSLTPNGKIDRKALPAPHVNKEAQYTPPTNEMESRLCEIWQEVLEVERVGINDNFFHLGGHSLLATRLVARCQEYFYVKLPLVELFKTPTVAGLAMLIARSLAENNAFKTTITTESLDLIDELLAETENEVKANES